MSVASADYIENGQWWISRVSVFKLHRNKGLGSKLLQQVIKEVIDCKGTSIIVAPGGYEPGNEEKQFNFYKKNGFVETKEEKKLLIYKIIENGTH